MEPSNMNLSHKYYRSLVLTYSLRLIGALGLYLCFGVISQNVYAVLDNNNPLETTHGSLWLLQDDGSYTETIQLETEVDIDVSSIIARTTVRQRFRNNSNNWTEGLYTFPLPENAAIDTFSLHIGDRVIQGQVQERQQARESYNRAKQQGVHSSLVEQQRPNLFKTSLANIGPGEEITILIEYQQTLDYKDGTYRLRFPMVAGPRFHASGSISSHDDDTDISIRVTESGNVNPIYIHVLLDAGVPLEKINSSYHDIDIRQTSEHRYSIALNTPYYADRDFELTWTPELGSTPEASIFTQTRGDYDYALVTLMPPALHALGQQITPRDIIFILDVSGSMSGTSIQQAKASLIQSIKRLDPEDRFNIIWFNDKSERLFPDVTHATDEALAIAARVTDGLDADGGTVMLPALMLALEQKTESDRLRQIVFLTDGNVDNEKQLFSVIRNRLGNSRLFTIGIGSAPNSYFMRKAARAGRGTFTHIGDINEVQYKTEQLLKKLESPALTNIHAFSNVRRRAGRRPLQLPESGRPRINLL
jgi:Ca-activated chloride channel family protein